MENKIDTTVPATATPVEKNFRIITFGKLYGTERMCVMVRFRIPSLCREEDVIIPVPPGTTIRDAETGEVIREFTTETEDSTFTYLVGGKGGWGNLF